MARLKGGQGWTPEREQKKKKMGGRGGLLKEQRSYFTSGINRLLQKDRSASQLGTAAGDKTHLLSWLLQ